MHFTYTLSHAYFTYPRILISRQLEKLALAQRTNMDEEMSDSDSESTKDGATEDTYYDDDADQLLVQESLDKLLAQTKDQGITDAQFHELSDLVMEYRDIFRIKLRCSDGLADVPPYHVELKSETRNFRLPNRNYSAKSTEFLAWKMNRQVDGQRQYRNPKARYAAPALVVKKRNPAVDITKDFRMTVDFKLINQYNISELWPMPTLERLGGNLAGCRYFGKFDLVDGYFQFPCTAITGDLHSIVTPDGVFGSYVVQQGTTNAVAYTQSTMEHCFQDRLNTSVSIWIDDVLSFAATWEEYLDTLRYIFPHVVGTT